MVYTVEDARADYRDNEMRNAQRADATRKNLALIGGAVAAGAMIHQLRGVNKSLKNISDGVDSLSEMNGEILEVQKEIKSLALESVQIQEAQLKEQTQQTEEKRRQTAQLAAQLKEQTQQTEEQRRQTAQLAAQTAELEASRMERERDKLVARRIQAVKQVVFDVSEELKTSEKEPQNVLTFLKLEGISEVMKNAGVTLELMDSFEDKKYVKDCLDKLDELQESILVSCPDIATYLELRSLDLRELLQKASSYDDLFMTSDTIENSEAKLGKAEEKFEKMSAGWKENGAISKQEVQFFQDFFSEFFSAQLDGPDLGGLMQAIRKKTVVRIGPEVSGRLEKEQAQHAWWSKLLRWISFGWVGLTSLSLLLLLIATETTIGQSVFVSIVVLVSAAPAWFWLYWSDKRIKLKQHQIDLEFQKASEQASKEFEARKSAADEEYEIAQRNADSDYEEELRRVEVTAWSDWVLSSIDEAIGFLREQKQLFAQFEQDLNLYNTTARRYSELVRDLKRTDSAYEELFQGSFPEFEVSDFVMTS